MVVRNNQNDYWQASSIASNLSLVDVALKYDMTYTLTPNKDRVDARMTLPGKTVQMKYNFKPSTKYSFKEVDYTLPEDTFSFTEVNYTAIKNDLLVEHKTCSLPVNDPKLKYGYFF